MTPDKLIRMANQIATFFDSQPGENAAAEIADHLTKFWEPRMKDQIYAWADAGGEGLKPTVLAAIALMRQPA